MGQEQVQKGPKLGPETLLVGKAVFDAGLAVGSRVGQIQLVTDEAAEAEYLPFTLVRTPDGGLGVMDLGRFQKAHPDRIRRSAQFDDIGSFAEYVNQFKYAGDRPIETRFYADVEASKIVAVLDDHLIASGVPAWCSHTATFTARRTPEWEAWVEMNRKPMGQQAFAEFLEEHFSEIVVPSAAEMLEVATNLSAHRTAKFGSSIRLRDGQTQFEYKEDIRGLVQEGKLEIPDTVKLKVIPFQGSSPYQVEGRFRYRFPEGVLSMSIVLLGLDTFERQVFNTMTKEVQEATGIKVLYGRP